MILNGTTFTRGSSIFSVVYGYTYWSWSTNNPSTQSIGSTNMAYFQ